MSYALVHWVEENAYSVLNISRIDQSDIIVSGPEELIGMELPVKWDKREPAQTGRVINIGKKHHMQRQEAEMVKKAADESFEIHSNSASGISSNLGDQNRTFTAINRKTPDPRHTNGAASPEEGDFTGFTSDTSEENQNFNDYSVMATENACKLNDGSEVLKLREELSKERAKNKKLIGLLKKNKPHSVPGVDSVVNIGNGIELKKSFLDFITLSYSAKPSIFMRKIIYDSGLFTLEELSESSVNGKKSISGPAIPRSALNIVKFSTVKNYTIRTCGLNAGTAELILFEKSLKDLCTDARKRLKRRRMENGSDELVETE